MMRKMINNTNSREVRRMDSDRQELAERIGRGYPGMESLSRSQVCISAALQPPSIWFTASLNRASA